MKIRSSVFANRFLWLSVILFLISLVLPAIYVAPPSLYLDTELCRRAPELPECQLNWWPGVGTLLLGWLDRSPAWFANLLLPVLWWDMKRTKLQGFLGWFLSIGGSVLALSALSVTTVPDTTEGGGRDYVQSFGLGFYFWIASFLVCIVGYAVTRIRRDAS
jgi:hypothetical protein